VPVVIESLAKRYGPIYALRGVNLSVREGSIVGLVGPNGAGKTTLIKSVIGLVRPSRGRILVDGVPSLRPEAKSLLAYSPEVPEAPGWETPCSLLEGLAYIEGYSRVEARSIAREALEKVGLSEHCNSKVARLSKGMKKRLLIAAALVPGDRRYYFFDEPFTGLDPSWIAAVREIIDELKDRGAGVLISSHILKELEDIIDSVAILFEGRILFSGTLEELAEEASVKPVLLIRVDDPLRALQIIRAEGLAGEQKPGGRVRVWLGSIQEADRIIDLLRSRGVRILAYEVTEASLEDAYFQILRKAG
jgi:ABC-2 type transport system ATP-binding protein